MEFLGACLSACTAQPATHMYPTPLSAKWAPVRHNKSIFSGLCNKASNPSNSLISAPGLLCSVPALIPPLIPALWLGLQGKLYCDVKGLAYSKNITVKHIDKGLGAYHSMRCSDVTGPQHTRAMARHPLADVRIKGEDLLTWPLEVDPGEGAASHVTAGGGQRWHMRRPKSDQAADALVGDPCRTENPLEWNQCETMCCQATPMQARQSHQQR